MCVMIGGGGGLTYCHHADDAGIYRSSFSSQLSFLHFDEGSVVFTPVEM